MSPHSTAFSLMAMFSLLLSSIALPLDAPRSYSIVNVDGGSSPTTTPTPTVTQTQTIVDTVEAPGSVSITTVNVDSATVTVYVTVAPLPTTPSAPLLPIPSAPLSPIPSAPLLPIPSAPLLPIPSGPLLPIPSAPLPPTVPHGCGHPPVNSNSTSTPRPDCPCSSPSKTGVIPSAAKPSKSTPEVVGDGAPWRHGYTLTPTSTSPTAYATGSYNAPVAARPSGMTAPLPILPPAAPHWFNSTEIPNARRRIVVS